MSLLCILSVFFACSSDALLPDDKDEVKLQDKIEQDSFVSSFSMNKVTATTASFCGILDVTSDELPFCKVTIYYSDDEVFNINDAMSVVTTSFGETKGFDVTLSGLTFGTDYKYCVCVTVRSDDEYSDVSVFTTKDISVNLSVENTSSTAVVFSAVVTGLSKEDDCLEMGVLYNCGTALNPAEAVKLTADSVLSDTFIVTAEDLRVGAEYSYCSYVQMDGKTTYGKEGYFTSEMPETIDLSSAGTANCYIVSSPGIYKIRTVQGNSNIALEGVQSADVLWESFGTDVAPKIGELVSWTSGADGYVYFEIPTAFKEGNAVIASRNAEGTILWSWHIWLTDEPEEQVYFNDAGTMMDRNLGATSAVPEDFCALGLLYQWGRKDPFLNSYDPWAVYYEFRAKSTQEWPKYSGSDSETGMIAYATANPMTLINHFSGRDWYYTEDGTADCTRWQSVKTIYDPCPVGWRVPDIGVWDAAINYGTYSDHYIGANFGGILGEDEIIWYPAWTESSFGYMAGHPGFYWSVTPSGEYFEHFSFIDFCPGNAIAGGSAEMAVRCCKE